MFCDCDMLDFELIITWSSFLVLDLFENFSSSSEGHKSIDLLKDEDDDVLCADNKDLKTDLVFKFCSASCLRSLYDPL